MRARIYSEIFNHASLGMLVLDETLTILDWNRAMETMTGVPRTKALGAHLHALFPETAHKGLGRKFATVFRLGQAAYLSHATHQYLFMVPMRRVLDPTIEFMFQDVQILPLASDDGQVHSACITVTDVTDEVVYENLLQRSNERLERELTIDPLTGAYNRRYFETRLAVESARATRHGLPLTLVMVDVDHFKRFNDEHGHQVGDVVLTRVAQCCGSTVRTEDLFCRLGGEEFCALLPDTNLEQAMHLAERLRCAVESLPLDLFEGASVTASFGVAQFEPGPQAETTLVRHADEALYCAKRAGRNRVFPARDDGLIRVWA